jgi:hypothetical protein
LRKLFLTVLRYDFMHVLMYLRKPGLNIPTGWWLPGELPEVEEH